MLVGFIIRAINWNLTTSFGARVVSRLAPRTCEGGGTSAHTGTGGSSSPAYPSQKSTKNKNCKHRKIMLFYALLPEIRTPPATSLRTGGTPLVNAGGKASNHLRTSSARQIPICRTPPFRDILYLISQILYLFLSSRVSYLANRVLRVVDQLSPGARMAAAGFSSQLMEPSSWLGRLCQGSMQTNWGCPGLLQIRV